MYYQSVLSIASPYPGVSTTVKRNLTPFSSISTVDASNLTVWWVLSEITIKLINIKEFRIKSV